MIVVDASAVVAILAPEPDAQELGERLGSARYGRRLVSTISVWEAASAIARRKGCDRSLGLQLVEEFLALASIEPVAPDMVITALAVEAAQRFGMGPGYPGILNLGDCFSYATAKHFDAELLFKGDDFGRTDIRAA